LAVKAYPLDEGYNIFADGKSACKNQVTKSDAEKELSRIERELDFLLAVAPSCLVAVTTVWQARISSSSDSWL
jgi:hypothetical protein